MIEILLVEDSPEKSAQLLQLIEQVSGDVPVRVDTAQTAFDAGRALTRRAYDLMILDLQLPMRAGEKPVPNAGVEVLRSLQRGGRYIRPAYIIGLTAHVELASIFSDEFAARAWPIVQFRSDSRGWERPIAELIEHVTARRRGAAVGFDYDLAIITALYRTELEMVLALDASWVREAVPGDDTLYHVGTFHGRSRDLKVVAAAAGEMGMPAASAVSMKLIQQFRPRYLAMTGIAAGIKGHFGDVLVADQAWDYGSGKLVEVSNGGVQFLPAPSAIPLSGSLKSRFAAFQLEQDVLSEIRDRAEHLLLERPPLAMQMGPVASGASVLESPQTVQQIIGQNRKLIGVEMETYGVFVAASVAREPRPQVMSMKSICDFADTHKSDQFQEYAAFTSAQFLYEFAVRYLSD